MAATRDEAIAFLQQLPKDTKLYIRVGDNAWPIRIRTFNYQGRTDGAVYIDRDPNGEDHRNFPEGYRGAVETTEKYLP